MADNCILDTTVTVQIWTLQCLSFGTAKSHSANSLSLLHKCFAIIQHNSLQTNLLFPDTNGCIVTAFCLLQRKNNIFWWGKESERALAIQLVIKSYLVLHCAHQRLCFKSYSKMLLKQNNHSTTHKQIYNNYNSIGSFHQHSLWASWMRLPYIQTPMHSQNSAEILLES